MATWNDLINNVGDELALDSFKFGGSDVTHTQRFLNRTLQNMYAAHAFSWRVVPTPLAVPSVVNQTDYDLSAVSGGVKFQHIFTVFLDDGTSATRKMVEKSLAWYIANYANVAYVGSGTPIYYATVGRYTIRVAPKPSSTSYIITVYYTLEHEDITDFTVETDVANKIHEVIEIGMLARAYRYLRETDGAARFKLDYEFELDRIITEDRKKPNLTFVMQPFRSGGHGFSTEYWKNPFV